MLRVDKSKCESCAVCTAVCSVDAIAVSNSKAEIDPDLCIDCYSCMDVCPEEAIFEDEED